LALQTETQQSIEIAGFFGIDLGCGVSILQGQSLSGASFTSLKQLQEHVDACINAYNDKAEPFVWTKKKVRQRRFKGRRITQL
jgi:hypothetical protein